MLQVSHKAIKKWICYKKKSYFIFNSLWTLSTTSTSQAKKMIHATLSHFRVRTQWLEWNKMIRIQTRLTTFCMFLCTSHAACHFSYSSVPFFFFLFAPFLLLLFALENYTLISKCLLLTRSVHTTLRVPCPEACIPFPVCIAPTVFLASSPISLSPFRFSLSLCRTKWSRCLLGGVERALYGMAWQVKGSVNSSSFYAVSQRPRMPLGSLSKGCESYWHRLSRV